MKSTLALCLLTLVSGALIPVGAQANAVFSKSLGGNIPFAAAAVFLIAALATGVGILLTGAKPPAPSAFRLAPWWVYLSGFIFTFYLFTITFVAPRLGVGTAIALIVTGQIIAALAIDHFGLFGAAKTTITVQRAIGLLVMAVGVYLAKKPR